MLRQFIPVPIDALVAEFASGLLAIDICARSICRLMALGIRHFYVSNLPLLGAVPTMSAILSRVDDLRGRGKHEH